MSELKEFICYPFVVLKWTASTWWSFVKAHLNWSAIVSLIAFVIGAVINQWLIGRWPVLKESLGDPVAAIWQYLVYGILGVVGVHLVALAILLIAAPSQIYREQKRKIARLTPPPLNLNLRAGQVYVKAARIDIEELTLTNRAQERMELTFSIRGANGVKFAGAWHDANKPSTQDGKPVATVLPKSSVPGSIVFKGNDGQSFDDTCDLEIYDAVSGVSESLKLGELRNNGAKSLT